MGVDMIMSACPVPRYLSGRESFPLSDRAAMILKGRVRALPDHVLLACARQLKTDPYAEMVDAVIAAKSPPSALDYAMTRADVRRSLNQAIDVMLTTGEGCDSMDLGVGWIFGGGKEAIEYCDLIALVALSGITELPLDAPASLQSESAREVGAMDDLEEGVEAFIRSTLKTVGMTGALLEKAVSEGMARVQSSPTILRDLAALALRGESVM